MVRLSKVINPIPLTQSKVNYFVSYYDFVVANIGLFDNLSLDNHHSIIAKIRFQIDFNKEKCFEYLDNYFKSPILYDKFLDRYPEGGRIKSLIEKYQQLERKDKRAFIKKEIIENETIIADLKQLHLTLAETAFNLYLFDIISFLKCSCEISKHRKDIKQLTRFIVSEFLLKGYNKFELNLVFDKILSSDIDRFPFPKGVRKKADKHEFINKRSFQEQFEGIKNIIDQIPPSLYLFFRVFNITTAPDFLFTYDRVTFWNKDITLIQQLKALSKEQRLSSNFFDSDNFIIASVKVPVINYEIAQQEAINIIKKELQYLNLTLKSNAYLDPFHILASRTLSLKKLKGVGESLNTKTNGTYIHEISVKQLIDNPFSFLKKYPSVARNHFLQFEHLYIEACSLNKISSYWHYLESLIPNIGKDKVVKLTVSKLLLLNKIANHKAILRNNLYNTYVDFANQTSFKSNYNVDRLNINKWSLQTLAKKINHPFIYDLIEEYNEENSSSYKESYDYYYGILQETYGLRNAYIHNGIEDPISVIKLQNALPRLILRFRWIIFDALREKPAYNSFNDLLTEKVNEADRLLGNHL